MTQSVALRPASSSDIEFLMKVYASTREEELAAMGWPEEARDRFVRMQFGLQHKHYQEHYAGADFSIVECGSVPVGRIYVHRTPSEIRVMDISLLTEWRHRGIGSTVLWELIRESRHRGVPLTLHVELDNPVRGYYERLGFREVEQRGIHIFMERCPESKKDDDRRERGMMAR